MTADPATNSTPGAPSAPSAFSFGTKGETLARLTPWLRSANLCEQLLVDATAWQKNPEEVINNILGVFPNSRLAVRSSTCKEDNHLASHAGQYESVVGIEPTRKQIRNGLRRVVDSYEGVTAGDQILIQPLVDDVVISGVVLTRDLDRGSPYYVINYDDFSGRTDTVTGGSQSKEIRVHHDRPQKLRSPRFAKLIAAVREIEQITGSDTLDIEFCIKANDSVFILQVRRLAAAQKWPDVDDDAIRAALTEVEALVANGLEADPALAGTTTQFSEMADWNPAEMIGSTPRPLSLSLYRHLITDSIWVRARREMLYRYMPDSPLMVALYGRPYIDVRLSLNSFLPRDLEDDLANRLVDYQLCRLAQNRELHDKIEFEIAVTCLDFDFPARARELRGAGFSSGDIKNLESGLRAITVDALNNFPSGLKDLVAKTQTLLKHDSSLEGQKPLQRVSNRLNACMECGTLPFSILARHAFIATSLLRSLVNSSALSATEFECFVQNIHTITVDFVADMHAASHGQIAMDEFMGCYGHLRPGTYDIRSRRYDERPDLFAGHDFVPPREEEPFELSETSRTAIQKALPALDPTISVEHLLGYIAASIAARENAKFAFTRPLSDSLTDLTEWGANYDLSREDLSYLTIEEILHEPTKETLLAAIKEGRSRYAVTRSIALPHLIVDSHDVDVVRFPLGKPNFITSQHLVAPISVLDRVANMNIDGRIVLIEQADPGFDWIFSRPIKGLVTKHGGANSHMAIRCAEFGLPAAIGCGARLYESLAQNLTVELDCAAKTIRGIN